MDYYIHQIGDLNNSRTIEKLISILEQKTICSREILERKGINYEYNNRSFRLDISKNKRGLFYDNNIHKDRVSLSDPYNRFIARAIKKKIIIHILVLIIIILALQYQEMFQLFHKVKLVV